MQTFQWVIEHQCVDYLGIVSKDGNASPRNPFSPVMSRKCQRFPLRITEGRNKGITMFPLRLGCGGSRLSRAFPVPRWPNSPRLDETDNLSPSVCLANINSSSTTSQFYICMLNTLHTQLLEYKRSVHKTLVQMWRLYHSPVHQPLLLYQPLCFFSGNTTMKPQLGLVDG